MIQNDNIITSLSFLISKSILSQPLKQKFVVQNCLRSDKILNMQNNSSSDSESSLEVAYDLLNVAMLEGVEIKSIVPKVVNIPKQTIPKSNFWTHVYPLLPERAYKRLFRMKRSTIDNLTEFLFRYSSSDNFNQFRKRVCICCNYFATHERMFDLQFKYNCAVGFVSESIKIISILIDDYLLPQVVKWPDLDEKQVLQREINSLFQIPMCIGMMDGTYIYCKGYGPTPMDYTCRKSDFALNVVLFMDHKLRIRHYISNNLGSEGDEDILAKSSFNDKIFELFNVDPTSADSRNALGLETYFIVADKGLKNTNFIITPFDERGRLLSHQQHSFNYYLSRYRVRAEMTIGMLKLRFQILKERLNATTSETADRYVRCCIALHNYSIEHGDLLYRCDLDSHIQSVFDADIIETDDVNDIDTDDGYLSSRDKLYKYFKENIM